MNKKAKIATLTSLFVVSFLLILTVAAAPKKCNNNIDDDNDGLTDWPADPGCSTRNDNGETSPSLVCDNGADAMNDADALADFRLSGGDPGCAGVTDTSEIDGQCDDTVDNDGDTFIDYPNDPECTSFSDDSELGTTQCSDGVDNADADTFVDMNDPGCTSPADNDEISGQCDDTVDNDGDTHTDFNSDSKCTGFTDNDESPRDSCNDSDGVNQNIVGTVSGEDNSVSFSHTDFCLDATTVNEYWCDNRFGDYDPRSTPFNCITNTTSACFNGACV